MLSMRAIITQPTIFLRIPRHTIDIIVLPCAGMLFESEMYSMHKHKNQAPWRNINLRASSSLWWCLRQLFSLWRGLFNKITKSKPTLQAPHLTLYAPVQLLTVLNIGLILRIKSLYVSYVHDFEQFIIWSLSSAVCNQNAKKSWFSHWSRVFLYWVLFKLQK